MLTEETVNQLLKKVLKPSNCLKETQVGTDQTITWANSDPADTQKVVTFTKPTNPLSEYELIVYNPSEENWSYQGR